MVDATISNKFSSKLLSITIPSYVNDEFGGWNPSFTARSVIFITILGTIMLTIYLILRFLSACDMETLPVMARDEEEVNIWMPLVNGSPELTGNGDVQTVFSSSEDVDASKLCVICFDEQRNCFFVPCGHSATCRVCAERILSDENKVCPICRRLIRKSKRLRIKP